MHSVQKILLSTKGWFAVDVTWNIDAQVVQLPWGSRILSVGVHNGVPYLWCVATDDSRLVDRKIIRVGTDYILPEANRAVYIGTVSEIDQHGAPWDWHFFEANGFR